MQEAAKAQRQKERQSIVNAALGCVHSLRSYLVSSLTGLRDASPPSKFEWNDKSHRWGLVSSGEWDKVVMHVELPPAPMTVKQVNREATKPHGIGQLLPPSPVTTVFPMSRAGSSINFSNTKSVSMTDLRRPCATSPRKNALPPFAGLRSDRSHSTPHRLLSLRPPSVLAPDSPNPACTDDLRNTFKQGDIGVPRTGSHTALPGMRPGAQSVPGRRSNYPPCKLPAMSAHFGDMNPCLHRPCETDLELDWILRGGTGVQKKEPWTA